MPPRPFPSPFRTGIDICHVPRVLNTITRETRSDPRNRPVSLFGLLRRLLTEREATLFWYRWRGTRYIYGNGEERTANVAKYIAGRWAAKEAVIKASSRKISFSDIMITSDQSKAPYAIILDKPSPMGTRPPEPEPQPLPSLRELNKSPRSAQNQEGSPIGLDEDDGSPSVPLVGLTAEELWPTRKDQMAFELDVSDIEGQVVRLSISHDGDYAMAVALALVEPMQGDVGGEAAAREPNNWNL